MYLKFNKIVSNPNYKILDLPVYMNLKNKLK